jgi:N-acetylglucosamine-6-phosphate deacetylase
VERNKSCRGALNSATHSTERDQNVPVHPRPQASVSSPDIYFDLQVNGFAGIDFQQPDISAVDLGTGLAALQARGTRILLTLVTDRIDALVEKLRRIEMFLNDEPCGGVIEGYHLEGPYLSARPGFHGAHPPELMKEPNRAEFDRLWVASGGNLRLITLAPEWPGSPAFIRHATAHGVRIAIGHSDASDPEIDRAVEAGLTLCTHLGNGVPTEMHRHDNIIQRLLARDELIAVFIPDGIHLPPPVLKNFVRAKPVDKILFTTDCMAAAGAPPGCYRLGRLEIVVGADGVVRESGRTNFAGSSLSMDKAMVNVQEMLRWTAAQACAACGWRVRAALGLNQLDEIR